MRYVIPILIVRNFAVVGVLKHLVNKYDPLAVESATFEAYLFTFILGVALHAFCKLLRVVISAPKDYKFMSVHEMSSRGMFISNIAIFLVPSLSVHLREMSLLSLVGLTVTESLVSMIALSGILSITEWEFSTDEGDRKE